MELRAFRAEDQAIKKLSEKPQEFPVVEKKSLPCQARAWFRRLGEAALFAGFLSALALLGALILSV